MKLALIQQRAGNDTAANINKAVHSVKEAAAAGNGANIICFAELAFTPFYPQKIVGENKFKLAETIPGPTTDIFSKLAKEFGVVIILNLYEKDGDNFYDSSPLISMGIFLE